MKASMGTGGKEPHQFKESLTVPKICQIVTEAEAIYASKHSSALALSRDNVIFSRTSRPALGLPCLLSSWYRVLSREQSSRGVMLTCHLHLASRLKMGGALPLIPPRTLSWWGQGQLHLGYLYQRWRIRFGFLLPQPKKGDLSRYKRAGC